MPGCGLGHRSWPEYHNYEWVKTIDISNWYHYHVTYSSTEHKLILYQDGLKVFRFKFFDEVEGPLSLDIFEKVGVFRNFPDLMTNFNIYSRFFTKKELIEWTGRCASPPGDIYSWDTDTLNTTQEEGNKIGTKIIQLDRKTVCLDQSKPVPPRRATGSVKKIIQSDPDF